MDDIEEVEQVEPVEPMNEPFLSRNYYKQKWPSYVTKPSKLLPDRLYEIVHNDRIIKNVEVVLSCIKGANVENTVITWLGYLYN